MFVAPALPGNSSEGSFARKIGLGRQLQLLYQRAIMGSEGPGLQVLPIHFSRPAAYKLRMQFGTLCCDVPIVVA